MNIFLGCVSGLALLASMGALLQGQKAIRQSGRSADAAEKSAAAAARSAQAGESLDRQGRVPRVAIGLIHPALSPSDKAIYRVRNDGPQDLWALSIHRPRPPDRITYPLAITGLGYADDEITFSLKIGEYKEITLCCGAADQLPEFRVRIECESGPDRWALTQMLPPPRGEPRPPLGADPARAREAIETARECFQEAVTKGGCDKSFWLVPARKGTSQELRDNADRIGDAQLRAVLEAIATAWDHALALSPPERGVRVVNLDATGPSPADIERRRRLAEVLEGARQGLDRCAEALATMNGLEADN